MCQLIILQCVGKKVSGGDVVSVNDYFESSLGEIRNKIFLSNVLSINNSELLPAYIRYGAQIMESDERVLYRNINWQIANQAISNNLLKILIVSAYYGLIEYDTPIADYDLMMSKSRRFWLGNNTLKEALIDYLINHPDITNVQAFLSSDYAKALQVNHLGISNHWIRYDRGGGVARQLINPFLANLSEN